MLQIVRLLGQIGEGKKWLPLVEEVNKLEAMVPVEQYLHQLYRIASLFCQIQKVDPTEVKILRNLELVRELVSKSPQFRQIVVDQLGPIVR